MVSEDYVPPIIKVDDDGKKHIICPIDGKEFKSMRAYGAHWRRHKNHGELTPRIQTNDNVTQMPSPINQLPSPADLMRPQMNSPPTQMPMSDNSPGTNWLNNLLQLVGAGVDIYQRIRGGGNPLAEKFMEKAIENALLSLDIQNQVMKKALNRLMEEALEGVIEHE